MAMRGGRLSDYSRLLDQGEKRRRHADRAIRRGFSGALPAHGLSVPTIAAEHARVCLKGGRDDSQAFAPISGPPVAVGDGQNLDDGLFFPIHNGERKAVEDEFAGSVFATGPASRRSDYSIRRSISFRHT